MDIIIHLNYVFFMTVWFFASIIVFYQTFFTEHENWWIASVFSLLLWWGVGLGWFLYRVFLALS